MKEVLKDGCPSYSTVKIWVPRFWTDHFKVTDGPQSGQPTSATTEDKVNVLHITILENCWI
uniref:Mos1 transposase HTH domain-containing protein n=1 Tax=Octopus bimaculoides TaxID=37653 RepID=A0A0L8GGK9_OCTBM